MPTTCRDCGHRGTDSLVAVHPRLLLLTPYETVRERRRRRRYRARTGRYLLEFEVERLGHRTDETGRMWINLRDYEQLWKEGHVKASGDSEDEAGGRAPHPDAAREAVVVLPVPVVRTEDAEVEEKRSD